MDDPNELCECGHVRADHADPSRDGGSWCEEPGCFDCAQFVPDDEQ